jgi:hypothetical protein
MPNVREKLSAETIGELEAIANGELANAITYAHGEVAQERAEAFEYFLGKPFGNEVRGRSSVVTRDVMETVMWSMPSLMRIFTAGDDVVKFEPRNQDDAEAAAQATEYCNYVFWSQNDGFQTLYDQFFDALLQKNGVVKVWWDDRKVPERKRHKGLTAEEVAVLQSGGWRVTKSEKYADQDAMPAEMQGEGALMMAAQAGFEIPYLYDVTIERDDDKSQVRIAAVPPEEFLVSRNSRRISEDEGGVFHRRRVTISDLIAEGYRREDVEGLSSDDDDLSYSPEAQVRYDNQGNEGQPFDQDWMARHVWVTDCYILVDVDDDGITELRRVTLAGGSDGNGTILDHPEWGAAPEVPVIPFASVTPVPIPHRYTGMSLADLVMDLQLVHSTILRQSLDSLYLANNPRNFIVGSINMDDMLTSRPGGVVRGEQGSSVTPLNTEFVGGQSFPMIDYIDRKRMARTGVNKFGVGLDANKLQNESATAAMQQSEASNERIELIARIFAETGVKRMFWLIIEAASRYSQRKTIIRLRDRYAPVNPREWKDRFDMSARVGLGTGNKDRQMQSLQMVVGLLGGFRGDPEFGRLISPENVYNLTEDVIEAAGLKRIERYMTDPKTLPPPEPQPNPEQAKMQAEMQMKQAEMQAKAQQSQQEAQMRAEADQQQAMQDAEIARYKADLDARTALEAAQLKAAVDREAAGNQMIIQREKMEMDHQYRMMELAAEKELEREKMRAGSRDGQGNINVSD